MYPPHVRQWNISPGIILSRKEIKMRRTTNTRQFTLIEGVLCTIGAPYGPGTWTLTDGEANTLNQTIVENLRNNLREDAKKLKEDGAPPDKFQTLVDEYYDKYDFGIRQGGIRITDPVESAARELARQLAKRALRKQGVKVSDLTTADVNAHAERLLEDPVVGPQIRAKAEIIASAEEEVAGIQV